MQRFRSRVRHRIAPLDGIALRSPTSPRVARNGAQANQPNAPTGRNEATQNNANPSNGQPNRTNQASTGGHPRLDPQQVRATGSAQISQAHAAQIAITLFAASAPTTAVNVDVTVGAALPEDVTMEPLPSDVVDIVP